MRLLALGAMLCTGCAVGTSTLGPPGPLDDLPALPRGGSVVVVNGLGETLSQLDLMASTPVLRNDAALTGQGPNELLLAGDQLVLINSLSNSVTLYDPQSLAVLGEFSTGPRTNPYRGLVRGQTVWITCWVSHELIALDLTDGTIVQRVPAPALTGQAHPQGIAADPTGAALFITLAHLDTQYLPVGAALLWEVPLSGGAADTGLLHTLTSGIYASDVALTEVGGRASLVVACAGQFAPGTGYQEDGALLLFDLPTRTVRDVRPVQSAPVRVIARGPLAFGAGAQSGDICRVDWSREEPWPRLMLPFSGTGLDYCSAIALLDDTTLLALQFNSDRLYALDWETGAIRGGITVGDGPVALLVLRESLP